MGRCVVGLFRICLPDVAQRPHPEGNHPTAIRKNPDYFKPHALRGLVRFQQKKHAEAEQDLHASYQILPTLTTAYYLGELAFQRKDYTTAKKYFQRAAQGNGELAQKAQQRLTQIQQGAAQ